MRFVENIPPSHYSEKRRITHSSYLNIFEHQNYKEFEMREVPMKVQNLLLICGILASLLYIGTDILAGMLWEGYNFIDQAVSELSAIGAPTRPFVVMLLLVYDVLMIAFGIGVWTYSRRRALRITGGLLLGIGVVGFLGIPFPLQLGAPEATFINTIHSLLAGVVVLFFLLAIGFGAFACGKRFRIYSTITILILLVVGTVSAVMSASRILREGFITPPQWFGLIERIDIYCSMLWVAVLAIVLLWSEKNTKLD